MVYSKELVKRGFDLRNLTQQQKQLIERIERAERTKAYIMLDDERGETEIEDLDAKIIELKQQIEPTLIGTSESTEKDGPDSSDHKSSNGLLVGVVILIFTGLALAAGSRVKE